MPTPRPIIVASVAPVSGIATRCPSRPMTPSATASPTTAPMMGSPIATRLPSTSVRMSMAARMPTTSLLSVACVDSSLPIEPAAATWMPASLAGRVASSRSCAMASSSSPDPMSSSTGAKAVRPSAESRPAVWPSLLTGLVTLATCADFFSAETDDLTAALFAWSVSLPLSTWKTIGLVPFCCGGNRFSSRSWTSWLPVPGRSRSLLVSEPKTRIAPKTPTMTSTQAPMTSSGRRPQKRPRANRSPDTGASSGPGDLSTLGGPSVRGTSPGRGMSGPPGRGSLGVRTPETPRQRAGPGSSSWSAGRHAGGTSHG